MPVVNRTIPTSHGDIALCETAGKGLPVLLLHGNSSCKEVFAKQFEGELGDRFRLIAMDLPGHGASAHARDPRLTYSWPGYAAVAVEVLENLGVGRAAVYGWSLGGQIAMEMLELYPGIVGLMISGAPPVRPDMESFQQGFAPTPALMLAGQEVLTEEEFELFNNTVFATLDVPELREAARRTHGAARRLLLENLMAGKAADQRVLVERSKVPIAVVNGADDPIVNVDYIGGIHYGNLWEDHCFVLRGLGHVPFLQDPEMFNSILGRFLADMDKRALKTDGAEAGFRRSGTHAA